MEQIKLSKENPTIKFDLKYSFSHITIERIEADINEPDWVTIIRKYNPYLYFEYKNTTGSTSSYPLLISALISAFHIRPIFDFKNDDKIIVPYENFKKMTSLGDYMKELMIELKFNNKNNEGNNEFALTIFYETTPGVKKI